MILNIVPVDKNTKILRINPQDLTEELLEQEKKREHKVPENWVKLTGTGIFASFGTGL